MATINSTHQLFLAVVRQIPNGRVMSYGAIARHAGMPNHARHVGVALRGLPANSEIPWWRVVNAAGEVVERGLDGHADLQRVLLEGEGVCLVAGRVDMRVFAWKGLVDGAQENLSR